MLNVLAVMAHPDDEVLGCGGTLARHALAGDVVSVMAFTDGVGSREDGNANAAMRRWREWLSALESLGLDIVKEHESSTLFEKNADGCGWMRETWPDQQLDTISLAKLANYVTDGFRTFNPYVVYTHWPGDLNQDHRRVAEAVLIATRPVIGSTVRRVLACEIPESTSQAFGLDRSFQPNVFISLSDECGKRKRKAVACYASEKRAYPHPRSDQAVAERLCMWGGVAGVAAAEAFSLLREVVR